MRLQPLLDWLGWPTHVQRFAALMVFTILHMATTTYSTRMHNIHWNASNPLFRIDQTDNVIDINGGNHPWEYDQVNIVCPVYKAGTSEAMQEKYIIYSVSKQEYDSCRITQPSPKIIAVCNRPHELMYFTITFRSFTPTPGGLEFRPGQSYYFISTSSRNDLHRRVGGGCSTHNMKVTFQVADEEKESNNIEDFESVEEDDDVPSRPLVPESKPQTFYYPTSEVEQAEFYHHQQRHNGQSLAPWLQETSSASKKVSSALSLHFLLAISVLGLAIGHNSL
jgi:hypothetical protein